MSNRLTLGFFTSLSGGVVRWKKMGTLDRELQLYRRLSSLGIDVHVFSVDRDKDLQWCTTDESCKNLTVHALYPNWLPYNRGLLVVLMPFILISLYSLGRQMDILKTNQGHSGVHVLLASWLWSKPYISRSGYILSEQLGNRSQRPSIKDRFFSFLECVTMRYALCCFVPTLYLVNWCEKNLKCRQLELVPNNVDTEVFRPDVSGTRSGYVLAVGRVVRLKRYDLLVRACSIAGVPLKIIGDGPNSDQVATLATDVGCQIEMLGRIPNVILPTLMNESMAYVICSEYEGHPKSLIEAMSCGCACVGTDSPGICNQIYDGVNGILVGDSVAELSDAIRRVLTDNELAEKIRLGARQYALENFSLDSLAMKEASIIRQLIEKRRCHYA